MVPGKEGLKNVVDSTGLFVHQIEDELQGAKNGIKKIRLYKSRRKNKGNSRNNYKIIKIKISL